MKKKQFRSADRKACSRPTQESNHSGEVLATTISSTQGTLLSREDEERKPKIAWPAAKEKASYRKYVYSIWKIIQEVKKNGKYLNIVRLDLANAYGSVPHELLFKAMDFFHIPEKVKNIMRNYYNKFRIVQRY